MSDLPRKTLLINFVKIRLLKICDAVFRCKYHSAHASPTADKGQGCNDEWDMRHSECMFGLRVSVKTNIDY